MGMAESFCLMLRAASELRTILRAWLGLFIQYKGKKQASNETVRGEGFLCEFSGP